MAKTNPKKSVPKKSRAPRKGKKTGGAPKKKYDAGDFASCSVTRTIGLANANQIYSYDTFNLVDFQRAAGIAQYYQHYRMSGITLVFKPTFDVYTATQGGGAWKPNFYYMIDKSGSIPDNVTLEALKQMGAKPRAFDERPITVTWRPSVLTNDQSLGGGVQASQYKVSPWLNTNRNATNPGAFAPSDINHLGIKWYMEQGNPQGYQFSVEVTIQFQFKKPLIDLLTSAPSVGLTYAEVDASPDGVVGGTDGISIPRT